MADISKISLDGGTTELNIKDAQARTNVSTINEKIPEGASSLNPLATQDEIEDIWENNAKTGVHQLFDLASAVVTAGTGTTATKTSTGIRVQTTSNGTYRLGYAQFSLPKNADITISGTYTVASGKSSVGFEYSDDGSTWTAVIDDEWTVDSGGETTTSKEFKAHGNTKTHPYFRFTIYCTRATSEAGDVTFSNILAKFTADTVETVTDYAETNYQLTKNKVSYDFNARTGVHNLLPNKAESGGIFTVNADKSITVDGNVTAQTWGYLNIAGYVIKKGNYILSGCPEGGSTGSYFLKLSLSNTVGGSEDLSAIDIGEGVELTVPNDMYVRSYSGIVIQANTSVSNKTFYPMLRDARDTDPTYQPPTETNYQLTQNKVSYEFNARMGAKNRFKPEKPAIKNNIEITIASDYSMTASGTATASDTSIRLQDPHIIVSGGKYKVVNCGNSANVPIRVSKVESGNWTSLAVINAGESEIIAVPNNTQLGMSMVKAVTADEVVSITNIKIMFVDPSDTDPTYAPFAMTNQQLTNELNKKVSYDFNARTGVHQLLDPQYFKPDTNTISASDVTKTDIGEVTFNGTSLNSSEARFYYLSMRTDESLKLIGGVRYKISIGTPNEKVGMSLGYTDAGGTYTNLANVPFGVSEYEFICPAEADGKGWTIQLNCKANTVFDNYTVYPVLCFAEDTYTGKVPFAMTNRELTEQCTQLFKKHTISFSNEELSSGAFELSTPITGVPDGYRPLVVEGYNLGRLDGYSITGLYLGTNAATVELRGYAQSAITGLNGSYILLCVKSSQIS